MPIVDVTLVTAAAQLPVGLATGLADALGAVLQHPPGRVWVRVSALPSHTYAENAVRLAPDELPVFVCVLHADLPHPASRLGMVTVSIGVAAIVPRAGLSPELLIAAADAALYRAKQSGKNRVEAAESLD